MDGAGQKVQDFFNSPQFVWGILWIGLALLTIGLLILMRTRWGQSQALGKCAALSLLVHLLLACYATTVQFVSAAVGPPEPAMTVSLVDGPVGVPGAAEEEGQTQPRSWETFADLSAPELAPQTPRPEVELSPIEPSQMSQAPDLPAELPPSLPPSVAPEPEESALPEEASAILAPAPEAEPIDAAEPSRAVAESSDEPAAAGPERQAAPMDNAPPAQMSSVLDPPPTDVTSGHPGLPLDPTDHSLESLPAETGNLAPREATPLPLADVEPPSRGSSGQGGTEGDAAQGGIAGSGDDENGPPMVSVPRRDQGAPGLPTIYRFRTSKNKAGIARQNGGSEEAEAAVQAALKWLAAAQSADGRWDASLHGAGRELAVLGHDRRGAGANGDTGITGLALLAFLGAGHTHREGPYATNVQHGLEFLLRSQASNGNLGGNAETFAYMYCHGIATVALGEAYGLSGDTRLERPLRAAIAYSVSAQHNSTGSWRYQSNEPGDTSQLGWQLMALKSAELSGIEIPDRTRDGMVRFLKSVSSGRNGGLASYRPGERATRTMTAEALVCRQFLGMARENPSGNEAGEYLLAELPGTQKTNLYYWYYATLGMYQLQGEHWERWNAALQQTLLKSQVTEGELAGSWNPECIWGGYGGRVYSTALSALCLEVYYRFLPLYSETAALKANLKR